jgi:hypothetical protein
LHVRQRAVEDGRYDARRRDDQPESTNLHSEKVLAGRVVRRGKAVSGCTGAASGQHRQRGSLPPGPERVTARAATQLPVVHIAAK